MTNVFLGAASVALVAVSASSLTALYVTYREWKGSRRG